WSAAIRFFAIVGRCNLFSAPGPGQQKAEMLELKQRIRFDERLLAAGVLTQAQLDLARREQKRKGGLLGPTLVQLGFLTGEVLSDFLAKEAEAETVNLNRVAIDRSVLQLVPADLARRFRAMPVSRVDHTLTVALADP